LAYFTWFFENGKLILARSLLMSINYNYPSVLPYQEIELFTNRCLISYCTFLDQFTLTLAPSKPVGEGSNRQAVESGNLRLFCASVEINHA
jgi:hypothetical protein